MSIYIAIPTLYDNQIEFTVKEAITCADNPNDITIGLVMFETYEREGIDFEEFYKNKLEPLLKYPQVKFKRYKKDECDVSVGSGRSEALSMYGGEDYVLQVDSHTLFEKHWDTILVDIYKKALEETKNDKTIITSYLPSYEHLNDGSRVSTLKDKFASYPIFLFKTWDHTTIPAWRDNDLRTSNKRDDRLFVPCIKFNAQFAFANKHFVENSGLPTKTIFWEEEVIQTMNLLAEGFSLVFPNMTLPVSHLFQNDTSKDPKDPSFRVSGANPTNLSKEEYFGKIEENWVTYIKDPANKDKIKRFSEYTRVNLKYGPFTDWFIPPKYNR